MIVRLESLTYAMVLSVPMKRNYQRHLPHQIPEDSPIFLTWNLKGALPAEVLAGLRQERLRLEKQPPRSGELPRDRKIRENKILFAITDKYLDTTFKGPTYLKDPHCAKIVEDSIHFGVGERYDLFAWCVMANHVHVLLLPLWDLNAITQGIKGFTAHEINGLQKARGRVFWQDESYDHWARDEEEKLRIIQYIENNPVKAFLCSRPEDWQWSTARFRKCWPPGQPFVKP
jgi:REP element-mobilizing transposase RayT